MGSIIEFKTKKIDVTKLNNNNSRRSLTADLISPAECEVENTAIVDHTSEPIKNYDDILRISEYLVSNQRWRDNMLFIVGINFGLRVSDLRELRFCNLINDDLSFKSKFPVYEIKTRNTRIRKHNRYISINDAVMDAVTLYLEHTPDVSLSDYLFRSVSNRNVHNTPLHRSIIDRILKGIASDLDLGIKMSTHTLRKTFGYHQMLMSGNDPRKLMLLSKMFGHSSVAVTMNYIGLTNDEIEEAYRNLNLGSPSEYGETSDQSKTNTDECNTHTRISMLV